MPPLTPIQISLINASTVLSDDDIRPVVAALQQQVNNDFLPAWGVGAQLTFIPGGSPPPAGTWWLSILDDSDQAGALGYHDITPDGLPLGKVFAGTDLKYGYTWSVTASHELLEMLADPNINLTVFVQNDQSTGILYAYEVCDACEADNFGYQIGNVLVSDFVFPSWFESFRAAGSTLFDQARQIQSPLQLLAGGYIGVFDVNSGSGWQQETAEKKLSETFSRGNVGSRRERRRTPRLQWVASHPHKEIIRRAEQYRQRVQLSRVRRPAA
ncbi:MAG TPA: hypothetical protein VJK29_22295 [Terriglobales bacterium]|nr:hypothetical protein [Terriglobales bacterium]